MFNSSFCDMLQVTSDRLNVCVDELTGNFCLSDFVIQLIDEATEQTRNFFGLFMAFVEAIFIYVVKIISYI